MPLDEADKTRFEARLKEIRRQLELAEETGGEAEQTVTLDQSRMGRLSRMDAMQGQAMSVETGRRRRRYLQQLKAAQDRLANDTFGECLECGEPIDVRRLEFDPATRLCIECAEARE